MKFRTKQNLLYGITGQVDGYSWEVVRGRGSREPVMLFLGLGVGYPGCVPSVRIH